MTSPDTHPAERETPAGEAMRDAVAQWLESETVLYVSDAAEKAGEFCGPSGPIASELARLTERAKVAEAACPGQRCTSVRERERKHLQHVERLEAAIRQTQDAAEAALTTLRADHAAEVARKDEEIARLTFALVASPKYQKALDHCLERCSLPCIACQRLEGIRESAFIRRDALAPKETTDA